MTKPLFQQWLDAKETERQAIELRRHIEDELKIGFDIGEDFEGTKTIETDGYKVKITARHTRKIDSDKLQELANENGVNEYLSILFRWKPEINAKAFQAADQAITNPLLDAITTTPSRPTFLIVKE